MSNEPGSSAGALQLPRTPRREAIATLAGYDYQIWVSIEAWMRLQPDEAIFLEGAEDLDRVGADDATTVQIRRTQGSISLNTEYGRAALKNFWSTQEREQHGRSIHYHYLTTSEVALESNASFDGATGIETWASARYDDVAAEQLRAYLLGHLEATGSLLSFLQTSTAKELQEKLFRRFHWLTHQPTVEVIRESVLDRLAERLAESRIPRPALMQVRDSLFSYCWEQIKKDSHERVLSKSALDREVESATTVHVTLPLSTAGGLLAAAIQLPSLQKYAASIALLATGVPELPQPLLERPSLTGALATQIRRRESVLLTGSVFKGKTTIAAIAATLVCPDAWWIDLSGRDSAAIRDIFSLVTHLIESSTAPTLVVFDDLDVRASARRVYSKALQKLLHRASTVGKSLLLTAQGQSGPIDSVGGDAWQLVVSDVPPLDEDEIRAYCQVLGSPSAAAAANWSRLVAAQTAGHPRLVQVRITELRDAGWPNITPEDFMGRSSAVLSARQLARSLFADSVSPIEAEFVYVAAEFFIRPTREMLLHLGDLIPGLSNPGDVVDRLAGKWLETHASRRYRVTPILKATVGETWSEARQRRANILVYDAISRCDTVSSSDGAALVFHAFVARDGARLGPICLNLLSIQDSAVKAQVYQQLSWLVHVQPASGPYILAEMPIASVSLRQLQFNIAVAEGSSAVGRIVLEWQGEIDALAEPERGFELMFNTVMLSTNTPLPASTVLRCATSIQKASGQFADIFKQLFQTYRTANQVPDIPPSASPFQFFLSLKSNVVRGYDDFEVLVDWLSGLDDAETRQFDEIIDWPLVATMGAFVHSGWAAESEQSDTDWTRWATLLDRAWDVAQLKAAPAFGREVGKALSIIYGEYLNDPQKARTSLSDAESVFGRSPVLAEQLVNVHYNAGRFEDALSAWELLNTTYGQTSVSDPFAFRRAAIAAAELNDWRKASQLFASGAATLPQSSETPTRCALLADAAYASFKAGEERAASKLLVQAVEALPAQALHDGNGRWQAVLQMMNVAASLISKRGLMDAQGSPLSITPGRASNPSLIASELEVGQEKRVQLLIGQVGELESRWSDASPTLIAQVATLSDGTHPLVQFQASRVMLQHQCVAGSDGCFVLYAARMVVSMEEMQKLREPTGDAAPMQVAFQSALLGFLVMGLICAKTDSQVLLHDWMQKTSEMGLASVTALLPQICTGLANPLATAIEVVKQQTKSSAERAGAALAVLKNDGRSPQMTAEAQGVLTSILLSTGALTSTVGTYDRTIAKRFANQWLGALSQTHLLVAPRASLPYLKTVVEAALRDDATLSQVLSSAGFATGVSLEALVGALPSH